MTRVPKTIGLTLIEVLAALSMLAVVSTAGISILRDASATARHAADLRTAQHAYAQWLLQWDENPDNAIIEWMDQNGRAWRFSIKVSGVVDELAETGDWAITLQNRPEVRLLQIRMTAAAAPGEVLLTRYCLIPDPVPLDGAP